MREAPPGEAGITWLELLILFGLRGGRLDHELEDHTGLATLQTIDADLKKFHNFIRYLNGNCLLQACRHWWEKAESGCRWRLRAYGFSRNLPSIKGLPTLTEHEASAIAEALLYFKCKVKKEQLDLWKNGILELPESNYCLRGRPTWHTVISKHISIFGNCLREHADEEQGLDHTPAHLHDTSVAENIDKHLFFTLSVQCARRGETHKALPA